MRKAINIIKMNATKCLKEIPFKWQAFTNVYKSEPTGLERCLLVKNFICFSKGPSTHVIWLITLELAVQDVTRSYGLKRYLHKHEVDSPAQTWSRHTDTYPSTWAECCSVQAWSLSVTWTPRAVHVCLAPTRPDKKQGLARWCLVEYHHIGKSSAIHSPAVRISVALIHFSLFLSALPDTYLPGLLVPPVLWLP